MILRRTLLKAAGSLLAAPAILKADGLMRLSPTHIHLPVGWYAEFHPRDGAMVLSPFRRRGDVMEVPTALGRQRERALMFVREGFLPTQIDGRRLLGTMPATRYAAQDCTGGWLG